MEFDELNGCLWKLEVKEKRWDSADQTTQEKEERGCKGEGSVTQWLQEGMAVWSCPRSEVKAVSVEEIPGERR